MEISRTETTRTVDLTNRRLVINRGGAKINTVEGGIRDLFQSWGSTRRRGLAFYLEGLARKDNASTQRSMRKTSAQRRYLDL